MIRFRDSHGRFCSAAFFVQELKAGRVYFKDASGKRLKGKKDDFIRKVRQDYYQLKEKQRLQRNYQRKKREKVTGKKIKPEIIAAPEPEIIGPRGGVSVEKPRLSNIKTYIRWGYKTRRESGSDGPSARNARLIQGAVGFEEALTLTDFYYYFNPDRPLILSGELTLLDGGINYYQFQEDGRGYRHIIVGTEHNVNGEDILNV